MKIDVALGWETQEARMAESALREERVLSERQVREAGARWLWYLVEKLVNGYDVRAMPRGPAQQLEAVLEGYVEWGWEEPDWDVVVGHHHMIELCVACEAFPLAAVLVKKGKCRLLTDDTRWTIDECLRLLTGEPAREDEQEELPGGCEYFDQEWQSRALYFMEPVLAWSEALDAQQ